MDRLHICGVGNILQPTKDEFVKVQELKSMLQDYVNSCHNKEIKEALSKYRGDNDLLLKFIRGRKLNLQRAYESVISYTNIKHHAYPEMFPNELPDFVRHVIQNEILVVLKNRDGLGRTIVIFKASNWDADEISLEQIICAGRYITEALMNLPEFLQKGEILLTDCTGANISHAKHFTIPNIIKFVNVFWQAYPIQIKGLFFVNSPFFVRPLYALLKPFLPKKLKERILITQGVTELYKRIDEDILPVSLGGLLPEDEAFSRYQLPQ